MRILHGIMGLLYVSAALLGLAGGGSRTVAPLHLVYTTIWALLWVFLWRGVGRFVPGRDQARFWTVASILLIVLLHRITLTGR